jgi:integrase
VRLEAHGLLDPSRSTPLPKGSDDFQHACNLVLRAKVEHFRILAAQLSGLYAETAPRDPMFAGMAATGLPLVLESEALWSTSKPTLGTVAARFFGHKSKHDWVPKTARDIERVLALAAALIGPENPMGIVDVDDVKKVRDVLAQLPPNYMKSSATSGMTPQQAMAANAAGKTLAPKTQQKYFEMFRQLLKWAVDEGYLDRMPGSAIKVAGAAKANAIDKRHPYSAEQLQLIFSSPLFSGHQSGTCRHKPGTMLMRDGKYWVPLIALYSGMRMGEIVQLLVTDVKVEAGIWYFDIIKGESEAKQLKTWSSKRRVPIHPTLIAMGILDMAKGMKPTGRLFSDIPIGQDGYYSHNLSKWWGRYSRQVGFKSAKTAFHSFRHNFKDALLAAQVPEHLAKALMGHADHDVHASYGKGPSLTALQGAIAKVKFSIDGNGLKPGSSV